MTTQDMMIQIFCLVDDRMGPLSKQSRARLYPSERVTIGILFALKGGHFRAFSRWLKRNYDDLFAGLPDRTRIRLRPSIQARLASVVAMYNVLLSLFHQLHPEADPFQMSIAEFSLSTRTSGYYYFGENVQNRCKGHTTCRFLRKGALNRLSHNT